MDSININNDDTMNKLHKIFYDKYQIDSKEEFVSGKFTFLYRIYFDVSILTVSTTKSSVIINRYNWSRGLIWEKQTMPLDIPGAWDAPLLKEFDNIKLKLIEMQKAIKAERLLDDEEFERLVLEAEKDFM